MASTQAKAERKAAALGRISSRLGIQQADLHGNAKGDAEMALIITLERVADAIAAQKPAPPSAANIEKKLEAETGQDVVGSITVETVETIPAKEEAAAETDEPAPTHRIRR